MKKIVFMVGLMLTVTACTADPVPPHIQKKVDAIPTAQLEHHFIAERELCNSKRGEKKSACREKVRRDYTAREMMREEGNAQ
jgi:hypothetical protein